MVHIKMVPVEVVLRKYSRVPDLHTKPQTLLGQVGKGDTGGGLENLYKFRGEMRKEQLLQRKTSLDRDVEACSNMMCLASRN